MNSTTNRIGDMNEENELVSPPRSQFPREFDSPLSTKLEKMNKTPMLLHGRPRAPKTAPSARYYHRTNQFSHQKPQQIVFNGVKHDTVEIPQSPVFNPKTGQTYYEQTFTAARRLGSGSFGDVFDVYSKEDHRRYAVKELREEFRNCTDREKKLREVKKHGLLPSHPNLVGFVKAWEEKGRLYIQTELCEKSLSDVCHEQHVIPSKECWNIFIDLLQAVDVLHSLDLIHVDIKPDNIFLTKDGVYKLGDFGLIFDLKNDLKINAEEGDSKYLAREVLNATPTKAADIFSFGITILEAATDLMLPSSGDPWHAIRNGDIPVKFFEGVCPEMVKILKWMMSCDPSHRPTTQQLLRHPAVKKRLTRRKIFLKYHEFKTRFFDFLHTVWLLLLVVVHVIVRPFSSEYEKRKIEAAKSVGSTTPKISPKSSTFRFRERTPDSAERGFSSRRFDMCDERSIWSQSDDENHQQSLRNRHANTAGPRLIMNGGDRDISPGPFPNVRSRLNFDDDDTPPSSDSPLNASPISSHMNRFGSPPTKVVRRSGSRAHTDYRPTYRGDSIVGGSWSDSGEEDEVIGAAGDRNNAQSCPLRFRGSLSARIKSRPIPRLDFTILDSPERRKKPTISDSPKPQISAAVPSNTMNRVTKKTTPLSNNKRMIGDHGSSADEF